MIRLGKVGRTVAEAAALHIDRLARTVTHGAGIPRDTAAWLQAIDDTLHIKLSRVGLVEHRDAHRPDRVLLAKMIDDYIATRVDVTDGTRAVLNQFRRHAVRVLGDVPIASITTGHCNAFRARMRSEYSEAYTVKMVKLGRQVFRDAVDRRLIDYNPFQAVKSGSQRNPDRLHYVPAAIAQQLIDATPDREMKLIIALARFAGLRIPSEIQDMRWGDIAWDADRMTVHCPKLKHRGKGRRVIPIFPQVRPLLLDLFTQAADGSDRVFTRLLGRANLRTTMHRLMSRAGVGVWEKPFQNMRASAATDLCTRLPGHVAAAWLGHSEQIADMHYRQVTDDHFKLAIADPAQHKAQQNATESSGTGGKSESGGDAKHSETSGVFASVPL